MALPMRAVEITPVSAAGFVFVKNFRPLALAGYAQNAI